MVQAGYLVMACNWNGLLPHNLVQASKLNAGEGGAHRYDSQPS